MHVNRAILFVVGEGNEEAYGLIDRFRGECDVRVCGYDYPKIISCIGDAKADVVVFFLKDVLENDFIKQVSSISNPLVLFRVEDYLAIPEIAHYDIPINIFKSSNMDMCVDHIRMVLSQAPFKCKMFKDVIDDVLFSNFAVFNNQHLVGFKYMMECVNYCLFVEGGCFMMTDHLYRWVAKKNEASESSIHNALRRFAHNVWDRKDEFPEDNIFSALFKRDKIPSIDDFICEAANHIFFAFRCDFYQYYQEVYSDDNSNKFGDRSV